MVPGYRRHSPSRTRDGVEGLSTLREGVDGLSTLRDPPTGGGNAGTPTTSPERMQPPVASSSRRFKHRSVYLNSQGVPYRAAAAAAVAAAESTREPRGELASQRPPYVSAPPTYCASPHRGGPPDQWPQRRRQRRRRGRPNDGRHERGRHNQSRRSDRHHSQSRSPGGSRSSPLRDSSSIQDRTTTRSRDLDYRGPFANEPFAEDRPARGGFGWNPNDEKNSDSCDGSRSSSSSSYVTDRNRSANNNITNIGGGGGGGGGSVGIAAPVATNESGIRHSNEGRGGDPIDDGADSAILSALGKMGRRDEAPKYSVVAMAEVPSQGVVVVRLRSERPCVSAILSRPAELAEYRYRLIRQVSDNDYVLAGDAQQWTALCMLLSDPRT